MAESEDARPAIGIDLGTTNSRVGIWLDEENRFQLISNYLGHHTTPSYVAFTETERLIGDAAKDQASKNPANTVFGKPHISLPKTFVNTTLNEVHVMLDLQLSSTWIW
jgi:molecular chaperone DnaK (HSP70)